MLLFCGVMNGDITARRQKSPQIDEALFQRIAQDDRDAFETLYRATEKAVYAYILSIVKNPFDAQDVMQDTYLKIRSAAHLYQPMGKPMAWIFTISKNLCLMRLREHGRQADPEEYKLEDSLDFSYLTDREDRLVLQAALRILDDKEREIILLYAVSGFKHREIAQNLQMPLSTVLSKYRRGLKKLQKYLLEKEGIV